MILLLNQSLTEIWKLQILVSRYEHLVDRTSPISLAVEQAMEVWYMHIGSVHLYIIERKRVRTPSHLFEGVVGVR